MVIQCDQCKTTYNFDETLLKDGSVPVRCVRCQHVFTVVPHQETVLQQTASPLASVDMPTSPEQPAVAPPLPEWDADNNKEDEFSFAAADSFSFPEPDSFSFDDNEETTPAPELPHTSAEAPTPEFSFASMAPDEIPPEETPTINEPRVKSTTTQEQTQEQPPTIKKKAKTSKLMLFLLVILLIIAGVYGYCFVTMGTTDVMKMISNIQQQLTATQQQVPSLEQGQIQVDTSASYYVDNASAGQLFIIEGRATNGYSTPHSELKVIGTLYKERGTPLINQVAYCGNIINKKDLQTAPLSELISRMNNPFGTALSNVSIAPGQALPFMIVFSKIPENLNEFSVEAESSKVASK